MGLTEAKNFVPQNQDGFWGLLDLRDRCWLGDDSGPKTFADIELAKFAAAVASEQLGRTILARLYVSSTVIFKDRVPVKMTPIQAIRKLEGFTDES